MSLNFEQLAQLKNAILTKNNEFKNDGEAREAQFDKIFKYFEAQMRYSFEYEKGRNIYTVESKSSIDENEMSILVKDIINLQSKHHLHRRDKVVLSYYEIARNYNTDTFLYKIEIRKGKNLALKGPDMFLGQLLVRGTADWNQDKADHKKVFISPDIPFCDRKKADNMKITARAIRESGSGNTSYFTRLDVNHDQRKLELLVKKKIGKKSGKWQKVNDSDVNDSLKQRYAKDLTTRRQLYVPKKKRAPGASQTGGNTGNNSGNRNGATAAAGGRGNGGRRGSPPPPPRRNSQARDEESTPRRDRTARSDVETPSPIRKGERTKSQTGRRRGGTPPPSPPSGSRSNE